MAVVISTVNGGNPVIGTTPITITGSGFEVTQGLFGFLSPTAYYAFTVTSWTDTEIVAVPPAGMPQGVQYVAAVTLAAESPPSSLGTGAFLNGVKVQAGAVEVSGKDQTIWPELVQYPITKSGAANTWTFATTTAYAAPPGCFIAIGSDMGAIGPASVLVSSIGGHPMKRPDGSDLVNGDIKSDTPYLVVKINPPATPTYYAMMGSMGLDEIKFGNGSGRADMSDPARPELFSELQTVTASLSATPNLWQFPYDVPSATQSPDTFVVSGDWTGIGADTRLGGVGVDNRPLKRVGGADLQPGDMSTGQKYLVIANYPSAAEPRFEVQGIGGGSVTGLTFGNDSGRADATTDPENPKLFCELQTVSATRDGVTDSWQFPYDVPSATQSPDTIVVSSDDWTGIGADTFLGGNGTDEWPLKRQGGADLQPGDLTAKQKYLMVKNYPASASPRYEVQGVGGGSSAKKTLAATIGSNAIVNSSTIYLYKYDDLGTNSQDGSTVSSNGAANGIHNPIGVLTGYKISSIDIKAPKMAVGGGTVGAAPYIEVEFYSLDGLGWTSIAMVQVPLDLADVGSVLTFNNASGTTMINAKVSGLSEVIPDGKAVGAVIVPSSATDNNINLIGKPVVTIEFEEV